MGTRRVTRPLPSRYTTNYYLLSLNVQAMANIDVEKAVESAIRLVTDAHANNKLTLVHTILDLRAL